MKPVELLFLSFSDVEALGLPVPVVVDAVEAALREHAAGTVEMHPKIGVHPTGTHPANFIHAMPAYLKQMGACGIKWVSGFAKNFERGLPNVMGLQVLNDPDTGAPLAIMDAGYLTGLRTAAVSAIAARACAREGAAVLGVAGTGFQGRMHLRFLTALLPQLEEVRLFDVRKSAAEAVAADAAAFFQGRVTVCESPRDCVDGADVICTCTNGDSRIIADKTWFKPGAFGVGIEGGCAYSAEALHQADKFLVDDVALARYFDELGRTRVGADGAPDPEFPGGMPAIHATIGQVLTGERPGRERDDERIIAVPIGMAVCDVALASVIHAEAAAAGRGQQLRLM
ncbi:MAG: ornithine cyclodeaminase family protein [Deltaproteobacteria bacterium]|nr:ornithine cyclodeaminase family protein [Deltaproteobacteria bacterium]